MPLNIGPVSIPMPGDPGSPSAKDAQTLIDQALEKARTDLANAQTAEAKQRAQDGLEAAQNAASQVAARWAEVGAQQQNADTNSANALTNQQNANTNSQRAGDYGAHLRALDNLNSQREQALAEFNQARIANIGDANAIKRATGIYMARAKVLDDQYKQLNAQLVNDRYEDTNAMTAAVSQGNERNKDALGLVNNAVNTVGAMKGVTDPNLAAGAISGIMQAGQSYSNASGGAPIDTFGIADAHKAAMAELILHQGMSPDEAATLVDAGLGSTSTSLGLPPPGYKVGNPSAGGSMGQQGFMPGAAS